MKKPKGQKNAGGDKAAQPAAAPSATDDELAKKAAEVTLDATPNV